MKVKIDVHEGLKRFMRAIKNDTDALQHLMAVDENGCSIVHLLAAHGFEDSFELVLQGPCSTWVLLQYYCRLQSVMPVNRLNYFQDF